ncbi:unnamed protein product, partial [Ectocarpus fasciculatus]
MRINSDDTGVPRHLFGGTAVDRQNASILCLCNCRRSQQTESRLCTLSSNCVGRLGSRHRSLGRDSYSIACHPSSRVGAIALSVPRGTSYLHTWFCLPSMSP